MKKVAFLLLALLFIAIFNSICFNGARKAAAVFESGADTVEIGATITHSKMYTEVDEGTENDYWHAYVSYEYNGVEYTDVFYERMDDPPDIGEDVTVKINPEVPNELLPDSWEFILVLIISPIFLSIITVALFYIIELLADRLFRNEPKKDLYAKIVAGIFVLSKMVIESLVFYGIHNSIVFAMFSLVAGCSLIVFVIKKNIKKNTAI